MENQEEIEKCHTDVSTYIDNKFNELKSTIKRNDSDFFNMSNPEKPIQSPKDYLKEKQFLPRHSLLTEMFEVSHIKTIYNVFVAILIVFSLNTIVFDIIEGEKFAWDFQLITYTFGQLPQVLFIWFCMMLSTILILYPTYKFWLTHCFIHIAKISIIHETDEEDIKNGNTSESSDTSSKQEWIHFQRTNKNTVTTYEQFTKDCNKKCAKSSVITRYIHKILCLFWILLYIFYQISFIAVPVYFIMYVYDLPPASSFIIMLEQMRLLMKSHSFVHENIDKIRKIKKDIEYCAMKRNDGDIDKKGVKISPSITIHSSVIPDFTSFLYFLFAPTLIYRAKYPRTQQIRWEYVASNFAQVFTCLFYTYYIFVRFCIPVFKHFNQDHLTPKTMILSIFGSMLPGTMVLIIAFYGVLHSWLNAFAEMLTFSDRMFYQDWWNSTSFTQYYRTWNVVVHDWLYVYIYKDLRIYSKMNRPLAMLIVFQVSALAHELVIAVAFRFFYPVMFVLFGIIGFGAMFIRGQSIQASNILLWVMMFMGNGLLMTLYSMEWYARQNCHSHYDSKVADFFVPRSWYCNRLK